MMILLNWVRENFFGSKLDVILSIVGAFFIYFILSTVISFIINSDWTLILVNRQLMLTGLMPEEEIWRVWTIFSLTVILMTTSVAFWFNINIKGSIFYILLLLMPFLIFTTKNTLLYVLLIMILSIVFFYLGYRSKNSGLKNIVSRVIVISWIILLPICFLILNILDGPKMTLWGGFMINLILAAIAIFAGFPLGILLALGRASSYKLIKLISTFYIEVIRGAPLVAWLLLAWFVLPKFLPNLFGLSDLNIVVRAMIVLSFFASAYIAEVIRGGLQSIPRGQEEASFALGMSSISTTIFIVLPQAIKVVIPTVVSTFIAIFKDTSLVFILAITDLLRIGRLIPEQQQEFFGKSIESLCVVALLFWIVSLVLSQISRNIEKKLNI
ncbi:MAG: amino acid ABC transporter permease [Chloroflexota bacterium]|nr:amino acid ABC transporter permease [Chloroflexota bacterium]